jgi:uncharacterized RDD family membrane protein YckC
MKCPKCSYLGFETGERCKNCGYDFSLLVEPPTDAPAELRLREAAGDRAGGDVVWERYDGVRSDDRFGDVALQTPAGPGADEPRLELAVQTGHSPHAAAFLADLSEPEVTTRTPDLPLFLPDNDADDAPLVRLPVAPRMPISVRKTPEIPKLRPVVRAPSAPAPAFEFTHDTAAVVLPAPASKASAQPTAKDSAPATALAPGGVLSGAIGARAVAAVIDHGILVGIDLAVVYFTLRMTDLGPDQWRVLPLAPLLGFLLFVKVAYFSAFTSIGGQTIGKMAARLKVVADGAGPLGVSRALRRSVAGLLSLAPLGAGLLPAVFGAERRAFHDRIAGTRVIAWPSA